MTFPRPRLLLASVAGVVAASAAVSAVALGQVSTWGTATPSAADAGAPDLVDAAHASVSTSGNVETPTAIDAGPKPTPHRRAEAAPPTPAPDAGDGDGGSYEPTNVGFSFGIRAGYMVPFGQGNGSPLYGDVVLGVVPIGGDIGWFFTPHLYLGGYFQYGFGVGAGQNNDLCSVNDTGCTATMYRFGLVVHWHFRPETTWDPWIGAGLGYEVINLESTDEDDSTQNEAATLQGADVTIEAGLDFKPLRYLGFGPYAELATGPYLGTDSLAMHGWLSFGVRARTNL